MEGASQATPEEPRFRAEIHGPMAIRFSHMFCEIHEGPGNEQRFVPLVRQFLRYEAGFQNSVPELFKENIFELNDAQKASLYYLPRHLASSHLAYRQYYDKEMREKVEREEKILLEGFGYTF